ncbi:DEAD/DEAH box helicase [Leucobacter sp. BZR 635]
MLEIELDPAHRELYDVFLQRERRKLFGLIRDPDFDRVLDRKRFTVFRSLTLLRMLALDASLIDPQYEGLPSAKLDALTEHATALSGEGRRTLVFSQFTSFLDRARARLEAAGVRTVTLDGSTRNRDAVIAQFRRGDADVFLISLKAGGIGLNLTEADTVILLDPWWNPASEAQAIDRTHRIGQDRHVHVIRMIAAGTIEEKVLELQRRKQALFAAVIDDEQLFAQSITAADIRELLGDDGA